MSSKYLDYAIKRSLDLAKLNKINFNDNSYTLYRLIYYNSNKNN